MSLLLLFVGSSAGSGVIIGTVTVSDDDLTPLEISDYNPHSLIVSDKELMPEYEVIIWDSEL